MFHYELMSHTLPVYSGVYNYISYLKHANLWNALIENSKYFWNMEKLMQTEGDHLYFFADIAMDGFQS